MSPLTTDTGQVVIVSIRDVSERLRFYEALDRKNFELERASQAKDHFLANMSHELRTPLTVILGFARTLKMKATGQLNTKQEHQVERIENNADHLLSLLNELLDLAKVSSGDAEISLEPVDVPAVLEDVATSMKPAAKDKGLELTVQCSSSSSSCTAAGASFGRSWRTSSATASDTLNKGSVRVVVETETNFDRVETRIHVIDTGIGVKPEHSDKLFQPFVRLDESATDGGTGLGLHLSRTIAEAIGGRLVYESVYGLGSTFTLILVENFDAQGEPTAPRSDAA